MSIPLCRFFFDRSAYLIQQYHHRTMDNISCTTPFRPNPPDRTTWHTPPSMQEEERVYALMRDDNAEAYICKENGTLDQMNKNKIVFFFYQRGYNSRDAPFQINDFLSNDKAANALLDIIDKDRGSTTDEKALVRWEYWDKHLRRYLEYKRVKSFFKSDERLVLMVRRQKRQNCFIHAPTSAIAYKAAMDSENPSDATTLDNNQIVRRVFDIDMLHDLLLGNGGKAGELLTKLLAGTNAIAPTCVYNTGLLKEWCDLYGPVVVTGFVVRGAIKNCYGDKSIGTCNDGEMLQFDIDDKGKESCAKISLPALANTVAVTPEQPVISSIERLSLAASQPSAIPDLASLVSSESAESRELDEAPHGSSESVELDKELDTGVNDELDGNDTLTHAMVVIGYRMDDDGKVWFLIQNTWHGMILFEASGDYLASHMIHTWRGTIVAIRKNNDERRFLLPEKFTFLTENNAKISDGGFDGCDIAHDYFHAMHNDGLY
jgi:hypothetical protein